LHRLEVRLLQGDRCGTGHALEAGSGPQGRTRPLLRNGDPVRSAVRRRSVRGRDEASRVAAAPLAPSVGPSSPGARLNFTDANWESTMILAIKPLYRAILIGISAAALLIGSFLLGLGRSGQSTAGSAGATSASGGTGGIVLAASAAGGKITVSGTGTVNGTP